MVATRVDSLNSRVLRIIRKTNPTRIVLYSGYMWSRAAELESAKIPGNNDKYLIGYHHPYDPSNFVLNAVGKYGSTTDINTTIATFSQLESWSIANNIPVTADEFGAENACDYNSRMIFYATMTEQAISNGQSFNVWDDNGSFKTYLRNTRTWDDSKDVIIHTYKESPTQLKTYSRNYTVTLSWLNRTALNDSLVVERKTASSEFKPIATLSPIATQFYDSVLDENALYYYRLRTRLLDSIDLYSYPISVITQLINSTVNNLGQVMSQIQIFPNPASDKINITLPVMMSTAKLDVYDLVGQHMKSELLNNEENTLNLNDFSNGVYIFVFTSGNTIEERKVIIKH
jgi:hypothetical protein